MHPLILIAALTSMLALTSSHPSHGKWSSSYGWGVSHPTYASGYSKWSPSYDYGTKVWPASPAVWPIAKSYSHAKHYPSYKSYSSYPSYSSEYYPTSHVDYSSSYVPSYSSAWPSSYSHGHHPGGYSSSYSHSSVWPSSYSGHSSDWDWD